ncbi:hypothetical protein SAMN05421690_100950 [Nitrosomonas sp. Nm51]|nr:hypothetical protein [Nitrosomonas sp. Nm51]SER12961.1 hypothetical protein SAMN05421690_100950 [Nitrosomonas sp. Nm51]
MKCMAMFGNGIGTGMMIIRQSPWLLRKVRETEGGRVLRGGFRLARGHELKPVRVLGSLTFVYGAMRFAY